MKEIRIHTYKLKQDVAKLEVLHQAFPAEVPEKEAEGKGKVPEQVRKAGETLGEVSESLKSLLAETISVLKTTEETMEGADRTAARALESTR